MENKNSQNNLTFISANFGFFVDTISKLETSEMPLAEGLEIVDNATKQLERVPGDIGVLTNSKIQNILKKKNPRIKRCNVDKGYTIKQTAKNNSEIEYDPTELTCMKCASNTFVDVERSFNRYKAMLRSNRCHLKFESFELHVVSNCSPHEDYLDDSE